MELLAIVPEMSKNSTRPLPLPSSPPFVVRNEAFPTANPRLSLLLALSSQAFIQSQRNIRNFTSEVTKYVNPRRFEAKNLEEALMSVPDLETIPYRVLRREARYEIREVESFVVAETIIPGTTGFDLYSSSQGFNTLAAYLFGKNIKQEEMEMTTPVITYRGQSEGEQMEMTTPVISRQTNNGKWKMAFVMPSKYGENLPIPVDDSVTIRRVPTKVVAVTAFSGYITDDEVKCRETELRALLEKDSRLKIKDDVQVEVSQFNPPFTLPFTRRNEIALEVEVIDM